MLPEPQFPPVWVDQPRALQRMTADLLSHPRVAVDTESNSLYVYREQVCLVQFSTGEHDYLVDPLALTDLSPLAPIFANPGIEKIFHAAEYDLICLKRDFGFEFHSIFDSMLAARILGRPAIGLGSVLEVEFGVTVDKRMQRANWGQRPLSPSMLDYARLDTYYLIALRHRLKAALQEAGRWEVAEEDFLRMCAVPVPESENGVETCWRTAGQRGLSPQQMAVLKELCAYRDQQARLADLPPFKVLNNEVLTELAARCPTTPDGLTGIRGLPPRRIERHGKGLLQAVQRGLQAPPPQRNHRPRPDDAFLARLDRLRTWRKHKAQELKIESDVVLPREVMESIASAAPRTLDGLARVMESVPYRLKTYGVDILALL